MLWSFYLQCYREINDAFFLESFAQVLTLVYSFLCRKKERIHEALREALTQRLRTITAQDSWNGLPTWLFLRRESRDSPIYCSFFVNTVVVFQVTAPFA